MLFSAGQSSGELTATLTVPKDRGLLELLQSPNERYSRGTFGCFACVALLLSLG